MPSSTLVLSAEIKVEGAKLSVRAERALRSVRVEMSMWVPSRCTIRMVDPDFDLTDEGKFTVGKTMTVGVPDASTGLAKPVFSGEITDMSVETGASRRHELVVGALDKGHRLAVATKVRTFTNKSFAQIVTQVANEAGLTPQVSIRGKSLPYFLQTTSDYALLCDVALRTGCEWWVDDNKLHFKKRASVPGPKLSYGQNLYDFSVRYSAAARPNQVSVRGWDNGTQKAIASDDSGVMTSKDVPGIGATSRFATFNRSSANAAWGEPVVTGGYAVADAAEAVAVADALASRVDAAEVLARGVCAVSPDVKVGELATIADMGRRVSGDYLVTTVEHIVSPERVETHFTAGNKAPVGIADLLGPADAAPGRWGGNGLVVGKVTAITGDPDNTGRVKVMYPSLSDRDTSGWARLVSPGAGPDRGLMYMPEINDEVLVGFEHGDHRFPVVLGGLWSKINKPPVAKAADPVVSRMIKSREGHTFDIGDGEAKTAKHFAMTLADGQNKFRLGADKTELLVTSGNEVSIVAGSTSIKIDAQGGVTISGGAVTINATKDLSLKGMNVKIDAQQGLTLTANGPLKASGKMGATVDAGASNVTITGMQVAIN